MSLPSGYIPRYRKHRASGQAIVTLSGRDFYLGPYGTKTSHLEYDRLVVEWLAANRSLPRSPLDEPSVKPLTLVEVMAAYRRHALEYYRKNGALTNEFSLIQRAMVITKELYGRTPASEFGPLKLQAVRQKMISLGWSRMHINKQVGRLVRMFRWAASQELVSGQIAVDLRSIAGLVKGRSEAPDHAPVKPVSDVQIEQTLPFLPPVVADMVRLQRLTGMRPEEVCLVRPASLDQSTNVWVYRPETSKMEHYGTERTVFLGPRAQKLLSPYLDRPPTDYCFSPIEAEAVRRIKCSSLRTTPLKYGNSPGTNRKSSPQRTAGGHYTTASYRRSIARACELAFSMPEYLRQPPKGLSRAELTKIREEAKQWRDEHVWAPNRLRHSAATEIRAAFGLEAAQLILGHRRADVTQVYAERNEKLAQQVAFDVG